MLLQDRRDVLGEGHFLRLSRLGERDRAAVHLRFGSRDLTAGEYGIEGVLQVARRRFLAYAAKAVLVVDPPAVAEALLAVEHDDLGRPLHAQRAGAGGVEVLDEGELHVVLHRLRRHGDERIFLGRVDRDELHVLVAVLLLHLLERGQIPLGDRATRVGEHQHERLLRAEVVERARQ